VNNSEWYVYVVRCADDTLYCGVTTDLRRRIDQHNSGKGAKYTRSRRPVSLEWWDKCEGMGDAYRREYRIKRLPRREKLEMISNGINKNKP
jgi:putative endonuclease